METMEEKAIAAVQAGVMSLDDISHASTSEWVTICLALARYDVLAGGTFAERPVAWRRLNDRQRAIVRQTNLSFRGAEWDGPSCYI